MPEGAEDVAVLRVVVREGFSRDLADEFLKALREAVAFFEKNPPARADAPDSAFAH
jgi:glutamate decarboxylase